MKTTVVTVPTSKHSRTGQQNTDGQVIEDRTTRIPC